MDKSKLVNNLQTFIKIYLSFITIFKINFLIIKNKIKKKRVIIFFHPSKDIFSANDYLKSIFEHEQDFEILFLNSYFQIRYNNRENYTLNKLIPLIICPDFFVTNNVSDFFPLFTQKIYIHHDIYDGPLTSAERKIGLKKRLAKYDYLFVSNYISKKIFENLFNGENKIPKIKQIGYLKLDFLLSKYKIKKCKTIIIAPTTYVPFKEFSCINYLEKIISHLIKYTDCKVYLRPHPADRKDINIKKIVKKFKTKKNFFLDIKNNYAELYTNSCLMISDISGTAYTYSFLTKNPVIFFSPNEKKIKANGYDKLSLFRDRNKIGKIYKNTDMFKSINKVINKNYKQNIIKLMSKNELDKNDSSKKLLNFMKKI
jgi:hypothetical protein